MSWRSGTEMRAMDTGKLREEHSEGDLEKRKGWSSVDHRTVEYADSEVPSEESHIDRQQVSESRDPQNDDRLDNLDVTTNGSKCVDVDQIVQAMERRMEQRFHRLDETWNQIPRIMEQLQQYVDETKNMDSAVFQMKTHFIPVNDDEVGPASFSIDEAFSLTPSTSKDLDRSIEASFPRLRAYVRHLESTSTSAIAEVLVDKNGGPLFNSPSDETSSSSPSCTESWDQEIDEFNSRLSFIVELAVDEEVVPLANSALQFQEEASSPHSCTESLGENIGLQAIQAQTRDVKESMLTRHPFIQKVTTNPSDDQAAYSCRITWVESPTSSTPRREGDSPAKVSLLYSKDLLQSEDRITWDEVPIKSKSREETASKAKLSFENSEERGEMIQKQSPGDENADWQRFLLISAPSDESAGSTQSCTESMSTALLRAEIYCQEANLCSDHNEDIGIPAQIEDAGIPAQTKPQLSNVPTVKQTRPTPQHDLVTEASAEVSECCCHFAFFVDVLNASLEHACTSCDRCLSVAFNRSLPEPT